MNKIDYQIANNFCEEALMMLDKENDAAHWLLENKPLFESITIQPEGLPAIANCNFEGIYYGYIAQFHSMYQKMHYEENI